MVVRKQFDRELYEQNDRRARNAVLDYLASQQVYCVENSDTYGPDLICYTGLRATHYIEVEIKSVWTSEEFQYSTVQLPGRKAKFLEQNTGTYPIEFWILSADLSHALVIPGAALTEEMLVEVPNKYILEGEMFYKVPIDECILLDLRQDT